MCWDALDEAARHKVSDCPDWSLGGDVGGDVADHVEKVLRERSGPNRLSYCAKVRQL